MFGNGAVTVRKVNDQCNKCMGVVRKKKSKKEKKNDLSNGLT
jgi:hypothetical protein